MAQQYILSYIDMKKTLEENIAFYKKLYGGEDNVSFKDDLVIIPKWLEILVLHRTGLKTRKKRIVNKVLKKEFDSIFTNFVQKGLD